MPVVSHFLLMEMQIVGTAAMSVISKLDSIKGTPQMKQLFEAEQSYQLSYMLIKALREECILTDDEYETAHAAIIKRYKPVRGTLPPHST
jgi:hypothetical protein